MSARVSINSGDRFSRLTVVRYAGNTKHAHRNWECLCDCGQTTYAITSSLRNGNKQSCGCKLREVTIERNTKHGYAPRGKRIPEYYVWRSMVDRCYDVNKRQYKDYGGRGITICDEWRHSFENFYRDMGSRTAPKHQIERIDNDGNYEPRNCKWDTKIRQMRNTRKNVFLVLGNRKMLLLEWAEELGISRQVFYTRRHLGWTDEEMLTIPVGGRRYA